MVDAWEALADQLRASPFTRAGWMLAWARAFAPGRLRVLVASQDDELVGVLPFTARRGVLSSPTNWHTPVFGFLAADGDVRDALATSLVSRARGRVDVSFLDRADPQLDACVGAARRAGRLVVVRTVLRSPCVSLAGSWEDYRGSLARKARRDIERRMRRLSDEGAVTLDLRDRVDEPELARLLEDGFRLEGSGWKQAHGTAIASQPQTQLFYTEVARWAAAHGLLQLAFLRLDGRPIAFDLCLCAGSVTYVLKGGFDPALRRFAPGLALTYESLRRAFEAGQTSYELLGDEDPYKLTWTRNVRERVRFQAFSRSPRGRAGHLAWTHGRVGVRRALAIAKRLDARGARAG
ncbi:MAG TPA: GNAT family N-acetyltransferase [Solirubrobacteraceae bacterium]|nr:GNAT family N-acetyltransferase [Solirubrobacteraceae bacterium]